MKTIKLFIIALLLFAGSSTQAQVAVDVSVRTPNVDVHVGTNRPASRPAPVPAPVPDWGPAEYEDDVEYYYLPDIQVYYDIRLAQYIYFGSGKWIRSRYLPRYCRDYDLRRGYKVVLTDYHGRAPYTHFHTHKVKYYKGYKGKPQKSRGEYKVHYEEHDHNDHNDHRDNHNQGNQGNHGNHGNHDKHGGKGNNGKGKH